MKILVFWSGYHGKLQTLPRSSTALGTSALCLAGQLGAHGTSMPLAMFVVRDVARRKRPCPRGGQKVEGHTAGQGLLPERMGAHGWRWRPLRR